MNFKGRTIDPIALWSDYVEFPPNMVNDGEFTPLVCCPNPEHDTLKRHFQINLEKPLVHCFARCGISGSYQRAISMIEGIDERKARRLILQHSTGLASRTRLRQGIGKGSGDSDRADDPLPDLSVFQFLPEVALGYLSARGLSPSTTAAFRLGWNPDNARIVIPAFDQDWRLKFIIQRAIRSKDHPRYLYPDGSGEAKKRLLFGSCLLDRQLVRSTGLILVEGSFDAIKLYELGFRNVVATLGNSITRYQASEISKLQPRSVFLLFDKDAGGVEAIESAHRRIRKPAAYVCRYASGISDPADFKERGQVERSLTRSVPLSKWAVNLKSRS